MRLDPTWRSFLDDYKTVLLRMLCHTHGVFTCETGMTKTMKRTGGGSVIQVDAESEPFGVLSIELSVGRGTA